VIPVASPKGMTGMLSPGWSGASPSGNVGRSWSAVWIPGPHSLHLARFSLIPIAPRACWRSSSLASTFGYWIFQKMLGADPEKNEVRTIGKCLWNNPLGKSHKNAKVECVEGHIAQKTLFVCTVLSPGQSYHQWDRLHIFNKFSAPAQKPWLENKKVWGKPKEIVGLFGDVFADGFGACLTNTAISLARQGGLYFLSQKTILKPLFSKFNKNCHWGYIPFPVLSTGACSKIFGFFWKLVLIQRSFWTGSYWGDIQFLSGFPVLSGCWFSRKRIFWTGAYSAVVNSVLIRWGYRVFLKKGMIWEFLGRNNFCEKNICSC